MGESLMTSVNSARNLLRALLEDVEAEDVGETAYKGVSIDDRVELYLRAMHVGEPQREFSPAERAEARIKIIGYMAEDIARQIEVRKRKRQGS